MRQVDCFEYLMGGRRLRRCADQKVIDRGWDWRLEQKIEIGGKWLWDDRVKGEDGDLRVKRIAPVVIRKKVVPPAKKSPVNLQLLHDFWKKSPMVEKPRPAPVDPRRAWSIALENEAKRLEAEAFSSFFQLLKEQRAEYEREREKKEDDRLAREHWNSTHPDSII